MVGTEAVAASRLPGKSRLPVYCGLIPRRWFRRLVLPQHLTASKAAVLLLHHTGKMVRVTGLAPASSPFQGESPTIWHHTLIWKLNRPGVSAPSRFCFLSLASQRASAVVDLCDQHESDDCEPRDYEGSDHVVVLSVFRGLAPKSFGRSTHALSRTERVRNFWSWRADDGSSVSAMLEQCLHVGPATSWLSRRRKWLPRQAPPLQHPR
jgi:hypothetical protein